jgi:CHAT domain-containing protein
MDPAASRCYQAQPQSIARLESGKPTEQTLKAGDLHRYELALPADQLVQLDVMQRGLNVKVSVLNPAGIIVVSVDRDQTIRGSELVTFISDTAGVYRIEIAPGEKNTPAGQYEIRIEVIRPPTAAEHSLEDARQLSEQSNGLRHNGQYEAAFTPAEQALEIREKLLGPEDPLVADSLHQIAILCDDTGDYKRAEPLNLRALRIREKKLGPDHPDVADSLFNLAWIYLVRQDYSKSESFYQRTLDIQEKAFGPEHPKVATTLNDFALFYHRRGDYEKAAELDERVLRIREKTLGPDNAGVAKSINNLGLDYFRAGDYEKAEPMFQRAITVWERALNPDHPEVAIAVNNLALIYLTLGDYERAEPLQRRFLQINRKAFGENHPQVAIGLNNLATTYQQLGDYETAENLFRHALSVREKVYGPQHSETADALNNLAYLLMLKNPPSTEIEPLLLRSMAILEKSLGPENAKTASPIINLAGHYEQVGDFQKAEPLFLRALSIREKSLGPNHPEVAAALQKIATFYQKKGDGSRALHYLSRADEAREHSIRRVLSLGSERQKLTYLNLFANDIDNALSLHTQLGPGNQNSLELAFTTLLQRKGRALDAMSESVGVLRNRASADDQLLFARLSAARRRLAAFGLRGADKDPSAYQLQFKELEQNTDELEAEVSARSAQFRSESHPITLKAIQALIPTNSGLVEFGRYHPLKPDSDSGAAHYAAYILMAEGPPKSIELGPSSEIDQAITELRKALRDPERADVMRLARVLDEKLMRPVRALVGSVQQLLISPDGPLNLIPFAALVDEHNHYLVERYAITYLTSGRDLLRLNVARESKGPPVVLADPTFGDPVLIASNKGRANVDAARVFFGPLPGVGYEVQMLKKLMVQAVFITKEQATKAALSEVKGPSILHIATHGFFLPSSPPISGVRIATSSGADRSRNLPVKVSGATNPLLRSGLALAGANQNQTDGILTALEAASLDLWGTKLVVLSACDTGVGEVINGEGVYGLRRALVLAGAESQIMSLWPVSDRRTRDVMTNFYQLLLAGHGRGEAMRQVQLQMIRAGAHRHPYYWAGFIQTGEWANLQGQR